MMFPSGHPWWQKGIAQSMQRAACAFSFSGGNSSYTSSQSWTRTGTGRRVGVSRLNSMNPEAFPTGCFRPSRAPRAHSLRPARLAAVRLLAFSVRLRRLHFRLRCLQLLADRPLKVLRKHLHEFGRCLRPMLEQSFRHTAARVLPVPLEQSANQFHILFVQCLQVHHLRVAADRETTVGLVDVCDSS